MPRSDDKKTMAETLRKLEHLFTITPQRMRKIVDGFIDVLEQGLEKPGQMVVRGRSLQPMMTAECLRAVWLDAYLES